MNDRFFSDNIQYQVVLSNLEKNNGQLKCEICGRIIRSKSECHFDHILAYSKGGKSTLENCQILCSECNLSKSDKDIYDFMLEEKAKRFMAGEDLEDDRKIANQSLSTDQNVMTKEKFDMIVGEYIKSRGDIKKIDFTRDRNGLPSFAYVNKFYGSITELKLAFGLNVDTVWNKANIWERLEEYSKNNPDFKQKDLVKKNGLPSLPCILAYYPEYKNFSDIRTALGLNLNYELWTKEKVITACDNYLKSHRKITLKDLRRENGLPTSKVIYRFFGTMEKFQREIGSEVSRKQGFISKEELLYTSKEIAKEYGSSFESRAAFFEAFPYSQSVILSRFGSFEMFINEANITIRNTKKAKYTKQEVDDSILSYIKGGNPIPSSAKELSSKNLPSSSTILRFYEDWREPFCVFQKMINIANK